MHQRAVELIRQLELSAHPEGGYYKEVYRSSSLVESSQHGKMRSALTDIYYLLNADKPSRFHRVIHDEVWHYYEGSPLELIEIHVETLCVTKVILGGSLDKMQYKHCIKGGNWQAARTMGNFTLVGCTVAPGFDFSDFSFLKDDESACLNILERLPEIKDLL